MEQKFIQSIISIQSGLKAPKNQYNLFGKYKYRSAEDILEAVKPLLLANGLILTIADEMVAKEGRFYIKATATITDGKDSLSVSAYAREDETKKGMDGSQITGATSSYARKYALNGLLCIDDTKDSDTTNEQAQDPRIEEAKNDMARITSRAEFEKVWAKYPELHKNTLFINSMSNIAKKYPKP